MGVFTTLLDTINGPEDLNNLSVLQLKQLSAEIRSRIISVTSKNGGHLASNLGVVELTVALHTVFDSPKDAIIWDVSHQCYAHKILTGRNNTFDTIRQRNGLSGFTKQAESEHDWFDAGHSSTSISSALGLLTGRDLLHKDGKVIAVIGDGALTGGMAMEGLFHAGQIAKNLVIVLNDNKMSITSNHGTLSKYLSRLTTTPQYQTLRFNVSAVIEHIPLIGKGLSWFNYKLKRAIKSLIFPNNLFSDVGFEYVGPLNGHHLEDLLKVLRRVKRIHRPVVIHVVTKKGKGYSPAEKDPVKFHGISPFNIETGELKHVHSCKTFTQVFSNEFLNLAAKDEKICAITAAMATGTGLLPFAKQYPDRFFDVGIAEQHAVTFAGGLARSGMKPLVAIYSTFIQRAVDQLIHDIALQSVPSVFVLDRSGAVPFDGETHQGIFDISLLRPVPGISLLAPSSASELQLMLRWAFKQTFPVVIRYPKGACPQERDEFSLPIEQGRGVLCKRPVLDDSNKKNDTKKMLFVCTGGIFPEVQEATDILAIENNINADVYNLRFLKPLDKHYFLDIAKQYNRIFFVEDGIRIGGIGTYLESLVDRTFDDKKTAVSGFPDRFLAQGNRKEILEDAHLSATYLAKKAMKLFI
ncbi:MAG: 1-deoxy-D-xylulose-5-phosphate synthase [Treponema sp. CETP13]|nr:MAG: 1-deoxy-D-xylulose-5-phosphate synthase [Treponema sp. CETP13]